MKELHYILQGKLAVPVRDVLEWGRWFETADRKVARTTVGPVDVSTVFLGLDHSFGDGPPLLFETMVFDSDGGVTDWAGLDICERYPSWEEAEKGHKKVCQRVQAIIDNLEKQKAEC